MELNPCENGCVKAEINHQEQAVIKSMECLNLETNEGTGNVCVEDHVAKDLAGKYMQSFAQDDYSIGVNLGRCRFLVRLLIPDSQEREYESFSLILPLASFLSIPPAAFVDG